MSSIHSITASLQNTSLSYARVAAQGAQASSATSQPAFQEEGTVQEWGSGHKKGIWRLAAAGNGRFISCSYDKTAKIWDAQSQKCLHTFRPKSKEVLCAARNEYHLYTGTSGGSISIWNAHNFALEDTMHDPDGQGIYSIVSIDSNTLATGSTQRPSNHRGSWNHDIKIWDVASKHLSCRLQGHRGGISKIVKVDDKHIISCSADASLRLWDSENGQCKVAIEHAHSDYIFSCDTAGNALVSGGRDRQLKVFDTQTFTLLGKLSSGKDDLAHSSTIYDVCKISEHLFASAGRDGIVKVWDLRKYSHVCSLDVHDSFVYSITSIAADSLIIGSAGMSKEEKGSETNPTITAWTLGQC